MDNVALYIETAAENLRFALDGIKGSNESCRELSLAATKVQEAMMWLAAAPQLVTTEVKPDAPEGGEPVGG